MSSSHNSSRRSFLKKAVVTAYVAPVILSTQAQATYSSNGSKNYKGSKKDKQTNYKGSKKTKTVKYDGKGSKSSKTSKTYSFDNKSNKKS